MNGNTYSYTALRRLNDGQPGHAGSEPVLRPTLLKKSYHDERQTTQYERAPAIPAFSHKEQQRRD
jgi:hypothetical protein